MKFQAKLMTASVLFISGIAASALNGPVGTPCGGTTTAGTTMTGTQGWSTDPKTGRGYWSCCQAGTSCAGRDKPVNISVKDLSETGDGSQPVRGQSQSIDPRVKESTTTESGSQGAVRERSKTATPKAQE